MNLLYWTLRLLSWENSRYWEVMFELVLTCWKCVLLFLSLISIPRLWYSLLPWQRCTLSKCFSSLLCIVFCLCVSCFVCVCVSVCFCLFVSCALTHTHKTESAAAAAQLYCRTGERSGGHALPSLWGVAGPEDRLPEGEGALPSPGPAGGQCPCSGRQQSECEACGAQQQTILFLLILLLINLPSTH